MFLECDSCSFLKLDFCSYEIQFSNGILIAFSGHQAPQDGSLAFCFNAFLRLLNALSEFTCALLFIQLFLSVKNVGRGTCGLNMKDFI